MALRCQCNRNMQNLYTIYTLTGSLVRLVHDLARQPPILRNVRRQGRYTDAIPNRTVNMGTIYIYNLQHYVQCAILIGQNAPQLPLIVRSCHNRKLQLVWTRRTFSTHQHMHAIRKRCVLYNSNRQVPLWALVGSRPNRSAKLQRCTTTQQQYTSWSKPSCNTVATQRDHIVTRTGCTATLAATRGAVACQRYTCACLLANNNLN